MSGNRVVSIGGVARPNDLDLLRGWHAGIQSWAEGQHESPEYAWMVFRPDHPTNEALMRLSIRFPVVAERIREFLAYADMCFESLNERPEALERFGGALFDLMQCVGSGIRAMEQADAGVSAEPPDREAHAQLGGADEAAGTLKPSHERAKEAYEWAMSNIEGAENLTYTQLFDALQIDPRRGGEGLPDSAETFARYCRAAGIRRNTPRKSRGPTRSVRRASDL
jgi:hypothetical protein